MPLGCYNNAKIIGQFVTILSVNKTREPMGVLRPFFVYGRIASVFCFTNRKENHEQ